MICQSAHDRWVITRINGVPVQRHFDTWPAIDGDINYMKTKTKSTILTRGDLK
ncbi:MAG: hypothetical protein U5R06_05270 [candidate division KSB1 bacterium]|nr:hypothetical protein [candidate division KSB1 bacterium]